MKLTEAISRRIIDLCTERNLTPDMVLQNADASPTAVAMVISGNDEIIMIDVMERICDTLGMSLKEFFDCDLFAHF